MAFWCGSKEGQIVLRPDGKKNLPDFFQNRGGLRRKMGDFSSLLAGFALAGALPPEVIAGERK